VPIAGDYAFVAANDYEGVVAVHIADKANLTIAGFLQDDDLFDGATDVAIAGNYAFVPAYSEDAVTALDISNPNNLTVASHFKDDDLDGAESIDRREPFLCDDDRHQGPKQPQAIASTPRCAIPVGLRSLVHMLM